MRTLVGFLMLFLAGCGSSPMTNFFTLRVVADKSAHQASIAFPVQVAAVRIPPSLDRPQMVRMASDNRVEIKDNERWSASLDEMVRNVLSQDLAEHLPDGRVILPNAPAPPQTGMLVITIAEFGADTDGVVKLSGSWTLVDSESNKLVLQRNFQLDGGRALNAEQTAAAMSRALGQLASLMASTLSRSEISG